jgi:hypothetical protein
MVYEGLIMGFNTKGAAQGGAQGAAAGSSAGPWGAAIGAIGGAAIGAFASNSSSYKSYKYARKLQSQAAALNYKYAEKSALNSPSWNRDGLESAGYNPMLAVQNSTAGANSSWTSANGSNSFDMSQGMTAGVSNAHSVQRLMNETNQAESLSDAYYATADKAKAEKAEISARLPFVPKRQRAEIAQIEGDVQLMEAKRHYMEEQVALQEAGLTVQQEANANQAEYNRILKNSSPSGKSQSFRNYTDGVRNIFSGVGDIIHGRNDNYEYYTDTREVTNGPKGRSSEKVTSKRSGKRKRR